jgi:hypothetical protein
MPEIQWYTGAGSVAAYNDARTPAFQRLVQMWGSHLPQSCVAALGPIYSWKCYLPVLSYPHLTVPSFIIEAITDSVVLGHYECMSPQSLTTPGGAWYAAQYAANVTRNMRAVVANKRDGIFAASCLIHCEFSLVGPLIGGQSAFGALFSWAQSHFAGEGGTGAHSFVDDSDAHGWYWPPTGLKCPAAAHATIVDDVVAPPMSAATVGDLQPVYDWPTQNCAQEHQPDKNRCAFSFKCKNMTEQNIGLCRDCDPDVVDAPTKAFRRPKLHGAGEETALTGSVNWGSRYDIGPDLDSVKHNCDVYYNASWRQEPQLYASREWIQSPWIFANQTAVGLTHMEHHCDAQGSAGSLSCAALNLSSGQGDFSAVTLLSSKNGGRSWEHARPPPHHVVAAFPQNFSVGGNRLGFRSPSNIVAGQGKLEGWFYATVESGWGAPGKENACEQFVDPLGLQHFCGCMMRTRDLTDPHSWRAWDGAAFSVGLFATPWDQPAPDPAKHVCQPTINMTYPSILWSTFYSKYIILGTTGGNDHDGWSFQLSDDLITWGAQLALNTSSLTSVGGPGGNRSALDTRVGYALYAYPSLLDPTSPSMNYDTIGESGFLYLMGRRTPIPQATKPRGFYIMQDVLRVKVAFS